MFYASELLSMAKRGKLARCWLASILSEHMFKSRVSNKDVMEVDIVVTCEEILKVLNRNSQNPSRRFSLYLSSKLMCGVVKLYMYQLVLFEKSLSMTLYHLQPVDLKNNRKKNKKTTHDDPILAIDLVIDFAGDLTMPEPPLLTFDDFPNADANLLELSPRVVRRSPRDEMQSPTYFPPLTDEQTETWIDILEGDDFGPGDSEHPAVLQPLPTEGTVVRQALDGSDRMDVSSIVRGSGQKRSSHGDVYDTSAKRRRLDFEIVDGQGAEASSAVDPSFHEPSGQLTLPSIHEEIDQQNHVESDQPIRVESDQPIRVESDQPIHKKTSHTIHENSDKSIGATAIAQASSGQNETILNVPADSNIPQQAQKKLRGKRRWYRVDKNISIFEAVRRRNAADREAYTVPLSIVTAVSEHKRAVPLSAMLQCPSKTFEFGTDRPISTRQKKFSVDLIARFETAIAGSFAEDIGYSEILEHIRKRHTTIKSIPSRIEDRTGPELSCQENSAPEAVDSVSARPVEGAHAETANETGLEATSETPLSLVEVTDERIAENISETRMARNDEQPAVNIQPENENQAQTAINDELPALIIPDENREPIYMPQESVTDLSRPDVGLPPLSRGMDEVSTTHRNATSTEANDDIASSTSSDRLEETESKWTKVNLMERLSSEWRDYSDVPFNRLNPPGEKKIDVGACFYFLLELRMEKKVCLTQRDQIYIEEVGSSDNGHEVEV